MLQGASFAHRNPKKIANKIYEDLNDKGIDVLIDDRDERPGVKFADAELIGIPLRVTIGPRGLENGIVELLERSDSEKTSNEIEVDKITDFLVEKIISQRALNA